MPDSPSKTKSSDKDDDAKNTTTAEKSGVATEGATQTHIDQVAIVSRTADGKAHQNDGYEVIGLPDDATAEQKAAAENKPAKSTKA